MIEPCFETHRVMVRSLVLHTNKDIGRLAHLVHPKQISALGVRVANSQRVSLGEIV